MLSIADPTNERPLVPCPLSEKTRLVDVLAAASQKDGSGLVCARAASTDSTLLTRVRRFERVNEARKR
jgi:hypothetical protein